jgi:asparagine synthase (glutamine-hydrolysing)
VCGLAGVAYTQQGRVDPQALRRMAAAIRHRGPDGSGVSTDAFVGLAHVRLSIIDRDGGAQPMANHDDSLVVAYNGEIFNMAHLRAQLEAAGHRFHTRSDTEVLLHGYAEWGTELPGRLNGQFAFAINDRRSRTVFLARDRFGIIPLFYAVRRDSLLFGSEIKALLASGDIDARVDPEGLDQLFTFWAALPPRTLFRDIAALEPGSRAVWRDGRLSVSRYFELEFPDANGEPSDAVERLDDLMHSAVGMRLLADVPVGGYLSGGLDSSVVCTLASNALERPLRTFSVAFDDSRFDESAFQHHVASHAGTRHRVQRIGPGDIARVFPEVVRHAETPLLRSAPAPMFLLSKLARREGITAVLSGEGADEIFLGYDLFKETAVRLFCLRRPQSSLRPRLFERLHLAEASGAKRGDFWARYFVNAGAPTDPLFSHMPRFRTTAWIKSFYSRDFLASIGPFNALDDLRDRLPARFARWSPLARAAYLEMTTLLSPYLLASQGDRMAMASGVETRVPFLDHRLVQFAFSLPESSRLCGLRDKEILRRWAQHALPRSIATRPKQAYRAPDVPAFFGPEAPDYVDAMLQPEAVEATGIFDPRGRVRPRSSL